MTHFSRARGPQLAALLALTCALVAHAGENAESTQLPDIEVEGSRLDLSNPYQLPPSDAVTDAAELLRRAPGGAVNRNGTLSGIPQYRGLYGARLNVQVDGMPIASGGPNWMDPPLHYAPAPLLQEVALTRGIAPVSVPGESLGGLVQARLARPDFNQSPTPMASGWLSAGAHSVDRSGRLAGLAGLASRQLLAYAAASYERGDDLEYPGGEILPTGYARDFLAIGGSWRQAQHEFSLDLRRNETGATGTPALPMDIRYVDSNLGRIGYRGELGEVAIEAWFVQTSVDHEMTNFHLRPVANPAMQRYAFAESDGQAWGLTSRMPLARGSITFGIDGERAGHNADIFDPNNPMFIVNNYHDIQRDLYGVFVESDLKLMPRWQLLWGVRYNHSSSTAGTVDGTPARMMPGPGMLRDRFNAAERAQSTDDIDWLIQLGHALTPVWNVELGVARKSRAPAYQERYLWLPLESTAGLADRHRYVGQIDLDSEVSHQIELGVEADNGRIWFAPRVFWRQVDDYIQGIPATDPTVIMVSTANGDPAPLQFANVKAALYGADVDMGWHWHPHWTASVVLSLVRGERRDIDDKLYRILPPTAALDLEHHQDRWSAGISLMMVDRQDRVSATNSEETTPGYAVVNLRTQWQATPQIGVQLGVLNLLDTRYSEHLGGYNRVTGTDIPVGSRLPGGARGGFASLRYSW